jgi:hypothetical protein
MAFNDVRPGGFPGTDVPYVDAEAISYGGGDQTISPCSRAVLITTAGTTLKVDMISGSAVTLTLPAGVTRICISKIYQTGSNAAGHVLR